jgi:hypothetical protein
VVLFSDDSRPAAGVQSFNGSELGSVTVPGASAADTHGHPRRRPRLLELSPHDEFQLFRIGDAAEPRERRGQLQILRDEALIFAIEEEADLAKRVPSQCSTLVVTRSRLTKMKDVAAERVARQVLRYERREPIKAFAHVGRGPVRIHRHAPAMPSHRSSASNRATDTTSRCPYRKFHPLA